MTTTIRIAVAARAHALKVPNAALRFRPNESDADLGRSGAAAFDDSAGHVGTGVLSLEELRAELTRDLVLTGAQQKRLDPILRQRQQQLLGLERLPKEQRPETVVRVNNATREKVRAILTPEQQALYDAHETTDGKGRSRPGVVWALDRRGAPRPIWLRLGITDGNFTEVLGGDLREGQQVVVAAVSQSGYGGLFSARARHPGLLVAQS